MGEISKEALAGKITSAEGLNEKSLAYLSGYVAGVQDTAKKEADENASGKK